MNTFNATDLCTYERAKWQIFCIFYQCGKSEQNIKTHLRDVGSERGWWSALKREWSWSAAGEVGGSITCERPSVRVLSLRQAFVSVFACVFITQLLSTKDMRSFANWYGQGRLKALGCSIISVPLILVAQSCLCGPMDCSTPCPAPAPGVYPNSCPLSRWCHPTISSSVVPFSSCLQSFPASGSFPMSQFLTSGGQSTGASASASVLGCSGLISFRTDWLDLLAIQGTPGENKEKWTLFQRGLFSSRSVWIIDASLP